MIKQRLKLLIEGLFRFLGLEVLVNNKANKPVGSMHNLLSDLCKRGLNVQAIFDIGAHKGEWSELAKQIFPNASVYLFEPQDEMQCYLREFKAKYSDVTIFQNGIGAINDKLVFTIWDDFAGSSFLPEPNDNLINNGKQRLIDVITLNSLFEQNLVVDYPQIVKLDIQGFELEALKGGSMLFGIAEVFILEVALFPFDDMPEIPTFIDVVNFMFERGYVVYDFGGFLRRPYDNAVAQCDLCFVKQNGQLRESNSWN